MLKAAIRSKFPPCFSSCQPSQMSRKVTGVGFSQAASAGKEQLKNSDKLQELTKPEKTRDAMASSFGEGYATRCDEEGFGGIYGGNQSKEDEEDMIIHDASMDHDPSQGSEVKDKGGAQNQSKIKDD